MPRLHSLPKSAILRGRNEFGALFSSDSRVLHHSVVSLRFFLLRDVPEKEQPFLQVGFITPKRLGKAPVRNKLRRQMREAFRSYRPQLLENYHTDPSIPLYGIRACFIAKRAPLQYDEVLKNMGGLLERMLLEAFSPIPQTQLNGPIK